MANPYHDETGRFCSRDEMLLRIDELGAERKLDAQWQLRDELYAADAKASGLKFGKRKAAAEQAKNVRYRIEGPILYHQAAMSTSPVLIENVRRVLEVPLDPADPHRSFHAIKKLVHEHYVKHPSHGLHPGVIGDTSRVAAMILDNFERSEEVDWHSFHGAFRAADLAAYELLPQN